MLTLVVKRSDEGFGLAVYSSSTAGTVKEHLFTEFFSIKRLFSMGPEKLSPKQLNHHFFQVALEQLTGKSKVSFHPGLSTLI